MKPITTAPRIRHNLANYRRQQAKRQIITITVLAVAVALAITL